MLESTMSVLLPLLHVFVKAKVCTHGAISLVCLHVKYVVALKTGLWHHRPYLNMI